MLQAALSFRRPVGQQQATPVSRKSTYSPTALNNFAGSGEEDEISDHSVISDHRQHSGSYWRNSFSLSEQAKKHKATASEFSVKKLLIPSSLVGTREFAFVVLSSAYAAFLGIHAIAQGSYCQQHSTDPQCTTAFTALTYLFLAVDILVLIVGAYFLTTIANARVRWAHVESNRRRGVGSSKSAVNKLLEEIMPSLQLCAVTAHALTIAMLLFHLILSHFGGSCAGAAINEASAILSLCDTAPTRGTFYLIAPVFVQATVRNVPFTNTLFSLAALFVTIVVLASTSMDSADFASALLAWSFSITALCSISFVMHAADFEAYNFYTALKSKSDQVKEQKEKMQGEAFNHKIDLALMYEILPPEVVECLREGARPEPKRHPAITCFFSDIVGFTDISSRCEETKVMDMLNDLYTVMDYVTAMFDLYKVETIGDAYMACGGTKEDQIKGNTHAVLVASFAVIVQEVVAALVRSPVDNSPVRIRIGMHSGPTVAGVVGSLTPRYCLFGDTINIASRMESNGEPGRIHISARTAELLASEPKKMFSVSERGEIVVKGKGTMVTHWIDGATAENEVCSPEAIQSITNTLRRMLSCDRSSDGSSVTSKIVPIQRGVSGRGDSLLSSSRSMDSHGSALSRMMSLRTINERIAGGSGSSPSAPRRPSDGSAIDGIEEDPASISVKPSADFIPSRFSDEDSPQKSVETSAKVSWFASSAVRRAWKLVSGAFSGGQRVVAANQSDLEAAENSFNNSKVGKRPPVEVYMRSMRRAMNVATTVRDVQNLRILIVDENDESARLESHLRLMNQTFVIDRASTGELAIKKLKACKFLYDVVFVACYSSEASDLQGHELVALIRAQEAKETTSKRYALIVGIISSEGHQQTSRSLLSAGSDEIWCKPLPPLLTLQAALLDLWKSRRSGAERRVQSWEEHKSEKVAGLSPRSASFKASGPSESHHQPQRNLSL